MLLYMDGMIGNIYTSGAANLWLMTCTSNFFLSIWRLARVGIKHHHPNNVCEISVLSVQITITVHEHTWVILIRMLQVIIFTYEGFPFQDEWRGFLQIFELKLIPWNWFSAFKFYHIGSMVEAEGKISIHYHVVLGSWNHYELRDTVNYAFFYLATVCMFLVVVDDCQYVWILQ